MSVFYQSTALATCSLCAKEFWHGAVLPSCHVFCLVIVGLRVESAGVNFCFKINRYISEEKCQGVQCAGAAKIRFCGFIVSRQLKGVSKGEYRPRITKYRSLLLPKHTSVINISECLSAGSIGPSL